MKKTNLNKLFSVAIMAVLTLGIITLAVAGDHEMAKPTLIQAPLYKFDEATFAHMQSKDKTIIIDVYKKGCPTCNAQGVALDEAKTMYPNAIFMRVDFENDTQAVAKFKAVKQSLIVVFKGAEEKGRSLGETDKAKLLEMIAKGV